MNHTCSSCEIMHAKSNYSIISKWFFSKGIASKIQLIKIQIIKNQSNNLKLFIIET